MNGAPTSVDLQHLIHKHGAPGPDGAGRCSVALSSSPPWFTSTGRSLSLDSSGSSGGCLLLQDAPLASLASSGCRSGSHFWAQRLSLSNNLPRASLQRPSFTTRRLKRDSEPTTRRGEQSYHGDVANFDWPGAESSERSARRTGEKRCAPCFPVREKRQKKEEEEKKKRREIHAATTCRRFQSHVSKGKTRLCFQD